MGSALSGDLRSRVLKTSDEGMSARQAAAPFGVGVSSAIRWIARAKIGELAPRPQGRGPVRACFGWTEDNWLDTLVARTRC